MRVAVVGAGIGGLATAVGLQQAGAEVVVLERSADLRPLGAGISIFGNGLVALDALGLAAGLRADSAPASTLRAGQRRPDGRWLTTVPAAAVRELRVVHRAELQQLLLDALDPGTVRCGIEVVAVIGDVGGVTVSSTRGSGGDLEERYDVVVAADGLRSRVRASWPGDPGVRYAGYTAWRGVTEGRVDLDGGAGETWGRGRRFGIAPLADGRVYWFAVATVPAGTRVRDEQAEVRRLFEGWHSPVPALLEATGSAVLRHDVHDLARPLPTFRRGGCVLLGDAAHAMTPDLGQGGNLALEDGVTLARLLAGQAGEREPDLGALDAALTRYDRLRRPRTQSVARQARALGRVAQVRNRLAVVLRDAVLRAVPPSAMAARLQAVQAWQPPAPAGAGVAR